MDFSFVLNFNSKLISLNFNLEVVQKELSFNVYFNLKPHIQTIHAVGKNQLDSFS